MGLRTVFRITMIVGLGLLAGGCYSAWHMRQFLHTAASTSGTVIWNFWHDDSAGDEGNKWRAYPQVRYYKADGGLVIFTSHRGANPPAYRLNQQAPVLYDPKDPYHAYIDSFGELWATSVIMWGIGLGFTAPEICLVAVRRAHASKEAWLRQNGRRIQAEFTQVIHSSYTVNGVHPYRILCQWPDPSTKRIRIFRSARIWYDPTKFIPGETLEVLVDRANPQRYSVQTPFLPKAV